ncbi:MAG: hypothetical protein GC192_02515 [Bacteroidetes bacterium]|nr:hypothetical protein [Bacteroidota bacterium]
MKNLICTFILALGFFFTSQAQILDVYTGTDTPDTWALQVAESNGGFVTFPNIVMAGGVYNQTITGPVSLPFQWRAADLTTGCNTGTFTINAVGVSANVVCGATFNVTLSQNFSGDYELIVKIQ